MPSPAPTELPSVSPTIAPTRWLPPGFVEPAPGSDEGYCIDNSGNRYDYYTDNAGDATLSNCPSKCSAVQAVLEAGGYNEQVRGFEYDGVTSNCHVLVDASSDRYIAGYTFVKASTATSAISPILGYDEMESIRCVSYQAESYANQMDPVYPAGDVVSSGQGTFSDSNGDQIDYIAFYDGNQMSGYNPDSCTNLCEAVFGEGGFLGLTIIRDETADVQGATPPPPYTGLGDFQVSCTNRPRDKYSIIVVSFISRLYSWRFTESFHRSSFPLSIVLWYHSAVAICC